MTILRTEPATVNSMDAQYLAADAQPVAGLDEATRQALEYVARQHGTPCYVYFVDRVRHEFSRLDEAFHERFRVSFAVKANPNRALLSEIKDLVASLDVSSIGEADQALSAGYAPQRLSFSGPAKRPFEFRRAVELGIGEIVCESLSELDSLNRLAEESARRVAVLLRINPKKMPRKFGISMAGKPSQFGIDEEVADDVLSHTMSFKSLDVHGFHIYSGTNSLNEDAIAENFSYFIEIFTRLSQKLTQGVRRLIFGSGFGIPYHAVDKPLDLTKLAALINPQIDQMKTEARLRHAECVLEMGRWLVGPHGYLLTSVVNAKHSRGAEIRICDAGFNNHLAACGMMGSVIRRNWRIWKVSDRNGHTCRTYQLVGPLCTTIDTLATDILLPELEVGDVLAIGSSGAYGLTSSPTRFISHPQPKEFVVECTADRIDVRDVSES